MKNTFSDRSALSRRSFIGLSALASAGLAVSSGGNVFAAEFEKKKLPIGIELYSVRGEMGKDLPGTLKEVAKIGYRVVEYPSMYFKWTPAYAKDVRAQMDDLGMRCPSTHNGWESFSSPENLARCIELNQILGCRLIVLASAPQTKGVDGWKGLGEKLTAVVEQLKPHGLTAGFHNHASEWAKLENGQSIMEVLAANTPKEFALQLDVGTCVQAKADPIAWVKANPGRIKSMHLKDWAPDTEKKDKGYRVLFGEGVTPWKELLDVAETVGGAEILLIEQEGSRFSEFETAKRCLENWNAMKRG